STLQCSNTQAANAVLKNLRRRISLCCSLLRPKRFSIFFCNAFARPLSRTCSFQLLCKQINSRLFGAPVDRLIFPYGAHRLSLAQLVGINSRPVGVPPEPLA